MPVKLVEQILNKELPPGPWHEEPDYVELSILGFDCIIRRVGVLDHEGYIQDYLCGYVGVAISHPWFKKDYQDGPYDWVDVHGGITFTDFMSKDKTIWYVGFDCAHLGDLIPGREEQFFEHSIYRSIDYVYSEVEKLAIQARKAKE